MEMKEYIIYTFGEKQGKLLLKNIAKECEELDKLCIEENPANVKTMQVKIFPRVAMYRALQKNMIKQKAYEMVWDYTKTCICAPTRQQYSKMDRAPFFFTLFRKMFLYIIVHSKAWSAEVTRNDSNQFGFAVHRCLWNDTCLKCGCPELCQIFCDSDWENFGVMRSIRFSRTQTLGTGGKVCDFAFYKRIYSPPCHRSGLVRISLFR